ncbi:MAG: ABC transporter permease [Firmicutes bacterium]|nr:ABC transporter permease [Bacillota bacterium]
MRQLISRNLKIFFRDKSSVFFSLLAVFIIIGLYILFLGDMMSSSLEGIKGVRFLMDSWIMGGLLSVTSITTTLGAFGIMVEDQYKKTIRDFYCSPVKRSKLIGGYLISTFIIGLIISTVAFILCEGYIVINGGRILPLIGILKTLGLIIITTLTSSSMVAFLVTFFKSQNAFTSFSTVFGTLIGFLTGIYIPVGTLPDSVQNVIKIFPISHAAVLFRQVFMEVPIKESFRGAPLVMVNDFKETLGVVFTIGNINMGVSTHILVLVGSFVFFLLLAIWRFQIKKKSI